MNTLFIVSPLIVNLNTFCVLGNVDSRMIAMALVWVLAIFIEGRNCGSRLNTQISAHELAFPPCAGVRRTGTVLYQRDALTVADKISHVKGGVLFLTNVRHTQEAPRSWDLQQPARLLLFLAALFEHVVNHRREDDFHRKTHLSARHYNGVAA